MSTRAISLADRVEEAAGQFARTAAKLPEHAWNQEIAAEEKTVAALVHHVAWALEAESAVFHRIAKGGPDSVWTKDWLDAENRKQAEVHAHDTKEVTLDRLRRDTDLVLKRIRSLTDIELERRGKHMPGKPDRSVAEWIEICLINHPRAHLPVIEDMLSSTSNRKSHIGDDH
jgi:uncharacterized damage-inducible protein DinB